MSSDLNVSEKIRILEDAMEQMRTEAATLLQAFRAQVQAEIKYESDEEGEATTTITTTRRTQQRQKAFEELQAEWELIRSLYFLVASNTQDVITSHNAEEKIKPMDLLMIKLGDTTQKFKPHEFQFPFNLTTLLSGIKLLVKNYIRVLQPLIGASEQQSQQQQQQQQQKFTSSSSYSERIGNAAGSMTSLNSLDNKSNEKVNLPTTTTTTTTNGPIKTNNVRHAAKMFDEITEKVVVSTTRIKRNMTKKPVLAPPPLRGTDRGPASAGAMLFKSMFTEEGPTSALPSTSKSATENIPSTFEGAPVSPQPQQIENAPAPKVSEIIAFKKPLKPFEKPKPPSKIMLSTSTITTPLVPQVDLSQEATVVKETPAPLSPVDNTMLYLYGESMAPPDAKAEIPEVSTTTMAQLESHIIRASTTNRRSLIGVSATSPSPTKSLQSATTETSRTPVTPNDIENPLRSSVAVLSSRNSQVSPRPLVVFDVESQNINVERIQTIDESIVPAYQRKASVLEASEEELDKGRASRVAASPPQLVRKITEDEGVFKGADADEVSALYSLSQGVHTSNNEDDIYADMMNGKNERKGSESSIRTIIKSKAPAEIPTQAQDVIIDIPATPTKSIKRKVTKVMRKLEGPDSDEVSLKSTEKPIDALVAIKSDGLKSPSSQAPILPVKSARPKTKLEELKSMTDQVAQRRKEISSVMISDRDYILGIMTAYDEVDRVDDDTSSSIAPSQSSQMPQGEQPPYEPSVVIPIFGSEVDRVLGDLDKTISGRIPSYPVKSLQSPKHEDFSEKRFENNSSTTATEAKQHIKEPTSPLMAHLKQETISAPINDSIIINLKGEKKETTRKETSFSNKKKPQVSELTTVMPNSRPYDPTNSVQIMNTESTIDEATQSFISASRLGPWMKPHKTFQLLLIPLNAMFDMKALDMSVSHRFGRNNTTNHPAFKGFGTLVVSRNHVDIFEKNSKIYIKDIGSNSGTFRNNARLSPPGAVSPDVELLTGDYIQMGKDVTDDSPLDESGRITARKRCVKFQVVIIKPGQTGAEAIQKQPIPIEKPVNRSDGKGEDMSSMTESADGKETPLALNKAKEELITEENLRPAINRKSENVIVNDRPAIIEIPNNNFAARPPSLGASTPAPPVPPKDKKPTQLVSSSTSSPAAVNPPPNANTPVSLEKSLAKVGEAITSDILRQNEASPSAPVNSIKEMFKQKASLEQYVLSYTIGTGKLLKIQVNDNEGAALLEVNLKKWEEKARITITDNRLVHGRTFDIFLETKPGAKIPTKLKSFSENVPWQVTNSAGSCIGTIVFISDIKMEITPLEKMVEGLSISITGDFKEKRFICVKKLTSTREQQRFGECKGKHQAKKSFMETQWLANLELLETPSNKLVLYGAILAAALNP